MRLEDVLRERGLVPEAELTRLRSAHAETGYGLAYLLVRSGAVDARALLDLLAATTGIPTFDPERFRPDPTIVKKLPFSMASHRRALVVGPTASGEGYHVACSDPTDAAGLDAVREHLDAEVSLLLVDEITMERALEHFYGSGTVDPSSAADVHAADANLDGRLDSLELDRSVLEDLSVVSDRLSLADDGGSTKIEALAGLVQSPADAAELALLRAGATPGQLVDPPGDEEGGAFASDAAFASAGNTEVHPLPGALTLPGAAPLFAGQGAEGSEPASSIAPAGGDSLLLDAEEDGTADDDEVSDLDSSFDLDDDIGPGFAAPPTVVDEPPLEPSSEPSDGPGANG